MSVCIPSYMLSAGMIQAGLSWRMALLAVLAWFSATLVSFASDALLMRSAPALT